MIGQMFGQLKVRSLSHVKRYERHWHCVCTCGGPTITSERNLRSGKSSSCGCARHKPRTTMRDRAIVAIKLQFVAGARDRNLVWELTDQQMIKLIDAPCHYCGRTGVNQKTVKGRGIFGYTGIDRVDSKMGYTTDNVLPCCRVCNHAKHTMSYVEFTSWIGHVSANRVWRKLIDG